MIRWIRPRLGTAPYDGVSASEHFIVDVRGLVDKQGNPGDQIRTLIAEAVEAHRSGRSVVVACDFGISRSNAIAAGVLSVVEELDYARALADVAAATQESEIKLDVADTVARALGKTRPARGAGGRTLVTGGSGFLGRALGASFEQTAAAVFPTRAELDLERGAMPLADYCDRENVAQIAHLAYPRAYTNAESAAKSAGMLRTILDVCRTRDIRLVLVSGAVVFSGYVAGALVADESLAPRPKGVYGETKYLEEQLVALHASRGDIRAVIVRLAAVYGPGGERPRLIRNFYARAMRGETITTHRYANGEPALDLLYVDDAVDAIRRTLDSSIDGVVHFGSGELHTTAEIARHIAAFAGRAVPIDHLDISETTSNVLLDSAKAARLLDWSRKIDLLTGLKNTLQSIG